MRVATGKGQRGSVGFGSISARAVQKYRPLEFRFERERDLDCSSELAWARSPAVRLREILLSNFRKLSKKKRSF